MDERDLNGRPDSGEAREEATASSPSSVRPPVLSADRELEAHEAWLSRFRGRNLIGLAQGTLPLLDAFTSGLRGLMLLAAAPNAGKTALAVQLGVDVVRSDPEACFLFASLEMPRQEIMTRIRCRLGGLEWSTLVKGSFERRHPGAGTSADFFNERDRKRLAKADAELLRVGSRIRILDAENFPDVSVESVAAEAARFRRECGASAVFVLVDYLQVWPAPVGAAGLRSEREADAWRIGRMKRLRDAVRADSPRSCVMVVSETRRPDPVEREWAGELADVMHSARAGYTPDIVLILRPVTYKMQGGEDERLKSRGMSHLKLVVAKGRDGVTRGSVDLTFHYFESRFEEGRK